MKKGCVYFIKHLSLSPIKIGFTDSDNPMRRFKHLCTCFPYGGELIGYIKSDDAYNLEIKLHKRFKKYRMAGEWFDIDLELLISMVGSIDGFELVNIKKINSCRNTGLSEKKAAFIEIYNQNKKINKIKIAKALSVSRQTIYDFIKDIEN